MGYTKDKIYDKEIYSESALRILNIHELREIGRKIGVPSPTTMKKTELIENIIKIASGKIEAPARSNFGRPSLNKLSSSDFALKIRKNLEYEQDLENFKLNFKVSPLSSPKQRSFVENVRQGIYTASGIVKLFDEQEIKISSEVAKSLKLEENDIVEAIVESGVAKIVTVNGVRVAGKLDFVKCFGETLCRGEAKELHYDFDEEKEKEIKKFISLFDSKIQIMLFSQNKHEGTNLVNFVYDQNANFSQIYKKFVQFLMICDEKLQKNLDLAIIIENKNALESAFALLDDDVYGRLKENINEKIETNKKFGNFLIIFAKDEELIY